MGSMEELANPPPWFNARLKEETADDRMDEDWPQYDQLKKERQQQFQATKNSLGVKKSKATPTKKTTPEQKTTSSPPPKANSHQVTIGYEVWSCGHKFFVCRFCCGVLTNFYKLRGHAKRLHPDLPKAVVQKTKFIKGNAATMEMNIPYKTILDEIEKSEKFILETTFLTHEKHAQIERLCLLDAKHLDEKKKQKEVFDRKKSIACEDCRQPFYSLSDYRKHVKIHRAKRYVCPVCHKFDTRKPRIAAHIKSAHKVNLAPHVTFVEPAVAIADTAQADNDDIPPADNSQSDFLSADHYQADFLPAYHYLADFPPAYHYLADFPPADHSQANVLQADHSQANFPPADHDLADFLPADHYLANFLLSDHYQADFPLAYHYLADFPPAYHYLADFPPAYHFQANFPPADHDLADFWPADHSQTNFLPADHDLADFLPADHYLLNFSPAKQSQADFPPADHSQAGILPADHSQADLPPADHSQADLPPADHDPPINDLVNSESDSSLDVTSTMGRFACLSCYFRTDTEEELKAHVEIHRKSENLEKLVDCLRQAQQAKLAG